MTATAKARKGLVEYHDPVAQLAERAEDEKATARIAAYVRRTTSAASVITPT